MTRRIMEPTARPDERKIGPNATAVFLWFFLALSVFYSGHLYSKDAFSKINSMKNLVLDGSPYIDPSSHAWGIVGRDGKVFSQFSIGSILMMAPPAAVWLCAQRIAHRPLPLVAGAAITGFNLLYTAAAGLLIFLLLVRMGKKASTAFFFANIAVFCTQLFPYAKTDWSEPSAFVWGLAGFVALMPRDADQPSLRETITWAACAMAASLIRIEYLLFFLFFIGADAVVGRRWSRIQTAGAIIAAAVVMLHAGYNWYRFGSAFNAGYTGQENAGKEAASAAGSLARTAFGMLFDRDTIKHVWWFFFSFGKNHWFWEAPLLGLAPFAAAGWKSMPRAGRAMFLAALVYLPLHIYLLNTAAWCCTDWSWGVRYFYVTFPYLLLPLAFFSYDKPWRRRAAVALCAIGLAVSGTAALTNFHVILENQVAARGYRETMFGAGANSLAGAPFWSHAAALPRQTIATVRAAAHRRWPLSWEQSRVKGLDIWPVGLSAAGAPPVAAFGLWLAQIGIAAWWGRRMFRRFGYGK